MALLGAGAITAFGAGGCSGADFSSDSLGGGAGAGGEGAEPIAPPGDAGQGNAGRGNGGAPESVEPPGGGAGAESSMGGASSDPSAGGALSDPSAGGGDGGGGADMPSQPIVKASDNFELSAEGWTIVSNKPEHLATHSNSGGHPGGMISAVDDADKTWYFGAPARYLGNAKDLYGGVLRFDLKVTELTDAFSYIDVQLASGNLSLVYDCSPDPSTAWTTYEVPFAETGWKVDNLAGAAATKEQFQQVLANITALRIRGEYNTGEDTGMLDNVYLGTD